MQKQILILSLIFIFSAGLFAGDAGDRKKSPKRASAAAAQAGKTSKSGHPNVEGAAADGVSFVNANGDTLMQVQDNGNVGIGTAAAESKLGVAGAVTADSLITGTNSQPDGATLLRFNTRRPWEFQVEGNQHSGTHLRLRNVEGGTKRFYIDTNGRTEFRNVDGSATHFSFHHNLGRLGIGTISPSTALEVAGTVTATAFVGDGSGLSGIAGDNLGSHIASQSLDLASNNMTNGDTITANLFIGDGSGLSGIAGDDLGSHVASQSLDLASNNITNGDTITANLFIGDGSGLTGLPSSPWLLNGSATYFNDGNVGIGTNTPNEQLELTGNLRLPASTDNSGIIYSAEQTLLHSFGNNNFFAGKNAGNLTHNNIASENTGIGENALSSMTTGDANTGVGANALLGNTTGEANTAVGDQALQSNINGHLNTAIGAEADVAADGLSNATAIGYKAVVDASNKIRLGNSQVTLVETGGMVSARNLHMPVGNATGGIIYIGDKLLMHTYRSENFFAGKNAGNLLLTASAERNTGIGENTLSNLIDGDANTGVGADALLGNTTGEANTAFGDQALQSNINGHLNTAIGAEADVIAGNLRNATAIGYGAKVDASNKIRLGNTQVTLVETDGTISAAGFVGDGSGLTGIPGDDLGSHTATQAFDLANNNVANGDTITANVFVGDGSGLTNLPISNVWQLTGNAGTDSTVNFIGTTDNQPLFLKANNQTILRLYDKPTSPNVIGGYSGNSVGTNVYGVTISGGGYSDSVNAVTANYGTISGGRGNKVSGFDATVGGGKENTASSPGATIGGGYRNNATNDDATVSGGVENTAGSIGAAVGGGYLNHASGLQSVIGGGRENTADGMQSTIGGGNQNTASGQSATIGGGFGNTANGLWAAVGGGGSNHASGLQSVIGGGRENTADGEGATVPGGRLNSAAGRGSFAAGYRAKIAAGHNGSFLFSDQRSFDFNSTAANEFAVRATGGVRFVTGIDGAGNPTQTVGIDSDGNVGIGTATPSSPLHIEKTLDLGALVTLTNNGTSGANVLNITSSSTGTTDIVDIQNGAFIVEGNGNVGIGTTTPGHRLHVAGTSIALTEGAQTVSLKTSESNGYVQLDVGGSGHSADGIYIGDLTNNTNEVIMMGNVGIGTATPTRAKVEIQGHNGVLPLSYGWLNNTGNTGTASNGNGRYSLYASNRIAAAEFNAFSDERIKNIRGRSDSKQDLNTLMDIEITDYTMIDTVAKGSQSQKKVIAQQVKDVFPQAVSTMTDVVPDIYQLSEIADGWVQLATDLQVGEKVKLIRKDGNDIYAVQAVRDGAFRVDLAENGEVFVYGREVDDFHTVDYEAIAMLNVSATQALYQRIQQQQKEIAALKELQAENEMLKVQVASFEKRLAQIEAALLSEKSDNADSVSD